MSLENKPKDNTYNKVLVIMMDKIQELEIKMQIQKDNISNISNRNDYKLLKQYVDNGEVLLGQYTLLNEILNKIIKEVK